MIHETKTHRVVSPFYCLMLAVVILSEVSNAVVPKQPPVYFLADEVILKSFLTALLELDLDYLLV